MSRFLMVTLPLTGHAFRALAVADELGARGHEVAWCGSKAYFGPLLGQDATLFPAGSRMLRDQAGHGIAALKSLWEQYVIPMARFTLPAVNRAVLEYQPDMIVVDQHALAGALAAQRHGLPWATLVTEAMELTQPLAALPRVHAWVRAQIAALCQEARVTDAGFDPLFSPRLVIAFTTAALTGERPFPGHYFLVGPAMLERPSAFEWDLLDPARRKVLITVGTLATGLAADFHRRAAAAVAPLRDTVQAIIVGPPDLLPDAPDNVLVVPSVPMLTLLPRLDAVISHGGMNTVHETLAHGVPLVLAPIRHDQPVVAAQVAGAGAGIRVPFNRVRPSQLREALISVLDDPSYRHAAKRIADSFAAAGGAPAAAARLEWAVHDARLAISEMNLSFRTDGIFALPGGGRAWRLASDSPDCPQDSAGGARMGDDIAQSAAGGPAPTMRAGAPDAFIPDADIRSVRAFRATARAAGGILDLVMPMRVGGDGPALFCVHPLIGLSWCYLALLPHVDARYPLYGLQARGVRRPEPLPATMAEMARDYADQLRKVQPAGPYHLLGWSLGGNIAFAIAEELERRGEQVGLLVILDADLANLDAISADGEAWFFYNMILTQFGYVPALTPADQDPQARMLEVVRHRPGLGLDEWPDKRVTALLRVIRNNLAVTAAHQPGLVHCPMLFFSCTSNPPGLAEKLDNWRSFVDGPVEPVELDCDHRHMLLPGPAALIGPPLSARLARAAH